MKRVQLDFINRVISIVTDQKTVIAYMDKELRKRDFQPFFPDKATYDRAEKVTFDFENSVICLKNPEDTGSGGNDVKVVPAPSLPAERQNIMNAVGWEEE